jgi:type 1 glutamine amidotransferase
MLAAFGGKPFTHHNEPYIFKGAYADKHFRPMLKMDTSKLVGVKPTVHADIRYMAWIRSHHKGRVFYVAASHGKDSYTRPEMLKFYLDGLQYVLGDLRCDDAAVNEPEK